MDFGFIGPLIGVPATPLSGAYGGGGGASRFKMDIILLLHLVVLVVLWWFRWWRRIWNQGRAGGNAGGGGGHGLRKHQRWCRDPGRYYDICLMDLCKIWYIMLRYMAFQSCIMPVEMTRMERAYPALLDKWWCMEDALVESQVVMVINHWVGGFLWHYITADILYGAGVWWRRCNTPGGPGVLGWHNDAGLATCSFMI